MSADDLMPAARPAEAPARGEEGTPPDQRGLCGYPQCACAVGDDDPCPKARPADGWGVGPTVPPADWLRGIAVFLVAHGQRENAAEAERLAAALARITPDLAATLDRTAEFAAGSLSPAERDAIELAAQVLATLTTLRAPATGEENHG
jgi:hypothetical protein